MASPPLFVVGTCRSSLSLSLRVLGIEEHDATKELVRLNDELLEAVLPTAGDDPEAVAEALAEIDGELLRRAGRLFVDGDSATILVDPALCVTLPFWQRVAPDARYLIWYYHEDAVVEALERHDGFSRDLAGARWARYMRSALAHTQGRPRRVVSVHELLESPDYERRRLAAMLAELGLYEPGFDPERELGSLEPETGELSFLDEPRAHFRDGAAMVAPTLRPTSTSTPTPASPVPPTYSPASVLREHAPPRTDADLQADAEARRSALAAHRESVDQQARATLDVGRAAAMDILTRFPDRLGQLWLDRAAESNEAARQRWQGGCTWRPQVMVGTLISGEREGEASRRSVGRQTYPNIDHVVLSGLPKKAAVATLMERFHASSADLLVKVDADMVLLDESFVERVIAVFDAAEGIDLLQMAVLDFFSGRTIQGINAYRQGFAWRTDAQDRLFTDKTQVAKDHRLVNWTTFRHAAIHAPDPHPFHAFHFGVHRGLKVLQPNAAEPREDQMVEQLVYLEATWEHYLMRRDPRLALAALGFELAVAGEYDVDHLDYTNPALAESFQSYSAAPLPEIEREVVRRRADRVGSPTVSRARARRREAYWVATEPIRSILVLLPHFGMFGGVNRFFYLAKGFGDLGIECVLAQPDAEARFNNKPLPATRPDHPGVRTIEFSEALSRSWDVVMCGDYSSGAMLTMPLFQSRLSAIYLLNGWLRREANLRQAELAQPDVVVANSSYVARYYADLAPVVVPGGVDHAAFYPTPGQRSLRTGPREPGEPFRVLVYGGRRKAYKRFEDVVEACGLLYEDGVPVELGVFDERSVDIAADCPVVYHGAVTREQLRGLLAEADLVMSGEDEAGWSNPCAEALASGVPVVCTEAGTTDFAHDGETALVVPSRTPAALAAAAKRIYQDPALGARLGRAGVEVMREFGWSDVARRLADVFATAARDETRRGALNRRARSQIERAMAA